MIQHYAIAFLLPQVSLFYDPVRFLHCLYRDDEADMFVYRA